MIARELEAEEEEESQLVEAFVATQLRASTDPTDTDIVQSQPTVARKRCSEMSLERLFSAASRCDASSRAAAAAPPEEPTVVTEDQMLEAALGLPSSEWVSQQVSTAAKMLPPSSQGSPNTPQPAGKRTCREEEMRSDCSSTPPKRRREAASTLLEDATVEKWRQNTDDLVIRSNQPLPQPNCTFLPSVLPRLERFSRLQDAIAHAKEMAVQQWAAAEKHAAAARKADRKSQLARRCSADAPPVEALRRETGDAAAAVELLRIFEPVERQKERLDAAAAFDDQLDRERTSGSRRDSLTSGLANSAWNASSKGGRVALSLSASSNQRDSLMPLVLSSGSRRESLLSIGPGMMSEACSSLDMLSPDRHRRIENNFTIETYRFRNFLEAAADRMPVQFEDLVPPSAASPIIAGRCFLQLLILASSGDVKLAQQTPDQPTILEVVNIFADDENTANTPQQHERSVRDLEISTAAEAAEAPSSASVKRTRSSRGFHVPASSSSVRPPAAVIC